MKIMNKEDMATLHKLTGSKKGTKAIKEREQIIVSERDREIFFDAIAKPAKPNTSLQEAVKRFKVYVEDFI